MATDVDRRLRYFNGQLLEQEDFRDEQAYHLDRLRRHNRHLHTPGIVDGLGVKADEGADKIEVAAGTALDEEGRLIVLNEERILEIDSGLAGQDVLVVISYDEQAAPASPGSGPETRWHERPEVEIVLESAAPSPGTHVRLMGLTIRGDGLVGAGPDESVRINAGGQLGDDVAVRRISLKSEGAEVSLWPSLSSGATNRLDVEGELAVTGGGNVGGDLRVTGAANLSGDLNVTGAANIGGDLTVSGQLQGLTASDLGALPVESYDLGRREIAYVGFNQASADGAEATINVGFQPKFVWASGHAYAMMSGFWLGGVTTGFADLAGTITQRVQYFNVFSRAASPRFQMYPYHSANHIVYGHFYDYASDPDIAQHIGIRLDLVHATGFTVSLYRSGTGMPFYIRAYLACFG